MANEFDDVTALTAMLARANVEWTDDSPDFEDYYEIQIVVGGCRITFGFWDDSLTGIEAKP